MKLRVLIADDEKLARTRLERLLSAMDEVEVVASCADGAEVIERVRQGEVDLVLLDIHMPHLSGTDAAALLPKPGPHIVFCTAHDDRAVQAFALGAADYLLKPVDAERLSLALMRVRQRLEVPVRIQPPIARLPVSTRAGIVLVDPERVSHAVLEGELVTVHTLDGPLLCDSSLRELEQRLAPAGFLRVHRCALLNLSHVSRLEPLESGGYLARTPRGDSVTVSRQAARELRRRLGMRKPGDDET